MKKIILIICVFVAFESTFAQASNSSESFEVLKAKIVKLESQIKDDVEIIRALRTENRALKRELRQLKGGKVRTSSSESQKVAKTRTQTTSDVKQVKAVKTQPRVESADSDYDRPRRKDSSVWDNMFPF